MSEPRETCTVHVGCRAHEHYAECPVRQPDSEPASELLDAMAAALTESLQHPDHVSDEVRKARNRHAMELLEKHAALAAARGDTP